MKPARRRGLVLFLLAFWVGSASLEADDSYGRYLTETYPADGPGAAAIVIRGGEVLYRGAVGMADIELGVSLSPDHVFRLGSITKQFTAASIMLLAEREQLSVSDDITQYLPDYPTHGHTITVEHLLTHTSGIFSYTSIPGYMEGFELRKDVSTDELIDVFDDLAMDFVPGTRWRYNNSAYVLLGAIIERVSGQSYAEFVQENIFDPLGMTNSYYGGDQIIERRAEGYAGTDGEYSNAPFLSMTQPHGGGSLLSTVDDMVLWREGLFGGELLSPDSVRQMTTDYKLTDGEPTGYGYGLAVSTFGDQPVIGHGGGIHGFRTWAGWWPDSEVYVVVLSNHPHNASGPGFVARQLAAEALAKSVAKREPITIDAERLSAYVGVYQIDDEENRAVLLEDGQLYTQRGEGGRRKILPYATDRFFYERSFNHLAFERAADGAVSRMLAYIDLNAEPEPAERVDAPPPPERETASVSPELYDLWTGTFQLEPGFTLVISRDGDRLVAQATGQSPFEIYPASATRYFPKTFEAEIEFVAGDDGRAKELVLNQGGSETRAERVE